jgi:hypothetical protein
MKSMFGYPLGIKEMAKKNPPKIVTVSVNFPSYKNLDLHV